MALSLRTLFVAVVVDEPCTFLKAQLDLENLWQCWLLPDSPQSTLHDRKMYNIMITHALQTTYTDCHTPLRAKTQKERERGRERERESEIEIYIYICRHVSASFALFILLIAVLSFLGQGAEPRIEALPAVPQHVEDRRGGQAHWPPQGHTFNALGRAINRYLKESHVHHVIALA